MDLGLNIHALTKRSKPVRSKRVAYTILVLSLLCILIFIGDKRGANRRSVSVTHQQDLIAAPGGLGISLGLFASDPRWDYHELIKEISGLGASQILIVIPLHQESHTSISPTLNIPLEVLDKTIRQSQERGLQVSLMPIIKLNQRRMNLWRGVLDPEKPKVWWSNYRYELKRIARVAQRLGVVRLIIGSELCSLEADLNHWGELIALLRARFSGTLSYSANWDHYQKIPFWTLLDEIAVTAYFPLRRQEETQNAWRKYLKEREIFASDHKRPLVISEYGYPALDSALNQPWDETTNAPFNPSLQARLVGEATRVILDRIASQDPSLRAAFLWNWFGFGGQGDRGYTLRGREGEQVLKQILERSNPTPTQSTLDE